MPATSVADEMEQNHVGSAGGEIVGAADDVWNEDRNNVLFGQPASGENRLDQRVDGAHRGIAHAAADQLRGRR